ncbi:6-bladed beta-propeller [Odoribacter splanchnicus]|nr:6-bladed beta-propeller [Odoribacter splanchnicus]MRZ88961.1 6-bladed beta-propeller [Odoribacter splanchnicus]MSA50091.1 6-bladed beta-propeller [Odoribacter splanchnicus]MSA54575.1 6-bladed beta-propeller [Odoribacter splanchnicus]MSA83624.1 6-bladed beta-propeller [Odoribacter splanchnicus]
MSMLKLESFFFFSFFLFLAGCGNQSKPVSVEQEIITPLSAGNAVDDLLPYIDSVEVVPLETTGKALIGLVGKILLLPNGNVLIKSTASMFMFSPEGKFLFQIGKNGRGPEEYLTIDDVCLSQDARELWILGGCEIVKYSTETGQFIRKTTLELPEICNGFDAIASGPGHSAFLYYCPQMDENNFSEDFYCLYRYDEQGRILQKFLPRKDYGLNIALITQTSDNRYILRPQDSDNICYYLSDSLPVPRVKIDFGKETIKNRYSSDLQTYLRSDYYKMPVYIYDTRDYFYFSYCGPEATDCYCIHSFKNSKTITWERKGDDADGMFMIGGADKDFFYGIYNDYRDWDEILLNRQDLLKRAIIQKTHLRIPEDSNPLLVKVKFKF